MEDMLDSTAGSYAFPPTMPSYQEINWIFDPYQRFRLIGGLDRKNSNQFSGVVLDVQARLRQAIAGNSGRIELDLSYKRIGGGTGWAMVEESGMNARAGMINDGIKAFVAVRPRPDGRFVYSIGRQSMFIQFPVAKILASLNEAEMSSSDKWGGGDLIGGSPRVNGSALSPDKVSHVIEQVLS